MRSPNSLESLGAILGRWRGVNRLWLEPGAPVRESESLATVDSIARGRGCTIRYTWAFEGASQDGLLLVMPATADAPAPDGLVAVLVDSWHVGAGYMACSGTSMPDGLSVGGTYAAAPGPDWGWRTTVEVLSTTAWRLRMYNLTPSGDESLAVEGLYEQRLG